VATLLFDQGPPVHVPFRFFATAPLFGAAAGVLLAAVGGDGLDSRWSPASLAFTHLFTLGFMLQAMCGALLQIIPVATGAQMRRPLLVAGISHVLLTLGAPLLAAGFLLGSNGMRIAGATLAVLGIACFVPAAVSALFRTKARGPTVFALRAATLALPVTAALGIVLVAEMSGAVAGNPLVHTAMHAGFGLGGWSLLLLMGVGYLVVPMFQITPSYPAPVARGLPWLVLAGLASLLLQFLPLSLTLLAGTAALFALATLYLQRRRKRATADVTVRFWRVAIGFLLVCAALLLALGYGESGTGVELALGASALVGVAVSAISGMVYRIVQFLNWMHLQQRGVIAVTRVWITNRHMTLQWWTHLAACLLLVAAAFLPQAVRPAGIALAVSQLWLGRNLWSAMAAAYRAGRR